MPGTNVQVLIIWKLVYRDAGDERWLPSIDHSNDFATKAAGLRYVRHNLKGLRANGLRYKLARFLTVIP